MKASVRLIKKLVCIVLSVALILPCFAVQAAGGMTESQECIDLIKSCEGFSQYKYWDYSQWTIGYGSGCGADDYPNGITEEEAEALLREYTAIFADYVNDFAVDYGIELTQNQFDALVSMSYSLGNLWDAYDEFDLKTILINGSENYSFLEIAQAFGEWRKAGEEVLQGLVKRRQVETELFLKNRTDYTSEVWRVNDESGVNLRAEASASSEKTGYMVMNTIFAITDKQTGSDGILWGKTEYEGSTHWIALDYCTYMVGGPIGYEGEEPATTEPTDTTEATTGGTQTTVSEKWKITSDNGVKLRSGPGLNYEQVGHVPYNAEITVTSTTECDGYLWGKTTYSGKNGWCVLDFAERISEQTLTGTTIKAIYIAQKPDKTVYSEGEQLDLSGLIVKAVYNDKTEKNTVEYDVSGFESKAGTYDVKVSYLNKATTFRVTVKEKKLTGIKVESPPEKTVYQVGEGLAVKGLKVAGVYDNNTTEELEDYFLENIKGFSDTPGTKTITVLVNDLTADFQVEVIEKVLSGIEITSLPENTEYSVGQKLDDSGMIVHATYSNGTKNIIDDYTISGYNSLKQGKQTVTVTYSGYTDTFDIMMNEPDTYELPGDLDRNGERDIFDLILLNRYVYEGYEEAADEAYLADVNLDGYINAKDVDALSRIVSRQ